MTYRILRLPEVLNVSGYSRSTLYTRVSQGIWTKQIGLGVRCVGWPESEVQTLVQAYIAGCNAEQLKQLVQELHRKRSEILPSFLKTKGEA